MPFEIKPCHAYEPIPPGARCQEASVFSQDSYIPCNGPAVAIVYHRKDCRSYYMCARCTDHNLRDRGGVLVRIKEDCKGLAHGIPKESYTVDAGFPDPNEGNTFESLESLESPAQGSGRVGAMIRKNVDGPLMRQTFLDNTAITLTDVELSYLLKKIGSDRVLAALKAMWRE
jgi:hypothetical protein